MEATPTVLGFDRMCQLTRRLSRARGHRLLLLLFITATVRTHVRLVLLHWLLHLTLLSWAFAGIVTDVGPG
jgi:hypothetical protein